jgi:anaerobic selenocysteine-containing dehydrogenase
MKTICGLCHTSCGMMVDVVDGKITKIQGNPEHPANQGILCPKGAASIEMVYSKDRLTSPLLKTPGGFKKISWDEALTIAADRLGELREKHGAGSLIRFGGAPVTYECRDGFMQFMASYGSPNLSGAGHLCQVPRLTAMRSVFGAVPEPDYRDTKLIIFWGSNPMGSTRYGNYATEGQLGNFRSVIPEARRRNIKVITIDPVRSETAKLSDEWIAPRLGTDAALALSMIHVIIKEKIYNEEFVTNWTSGFEKLARHVEKMTPEWAEPITGVAASTIEKLARDYALTAPATIRDGNGLDMNTNGVQTVRAVQFLIALTGNYDVPGGNVVFPWIAQSFLPDTRKVKYQEKRIGQEQFPQFPEIPGPALLDALLNEDRPRAMIVYHSNPALILANTEKVRRAFGKLNFLMVMDLFPTATAQMADLILPSASTFESYGYRAYSSRQGGFLSLRPKCIEPIGESRPFAQVEYELAKRLGMEKDYSFTNDVEWVNFMLKAPGLTIEDLREKTAVYAGPPMEYRKYLKGGFKTPSKKIEFYSDSFEKDHYDPLPSYVEPLSLKDWTSEQQKAYPFQGTSRKQYEYVHTKFRNLDFLKRLYPSPLVMLCSEDASVKGIKDGSMIEVRSPDGAIKVRAKVTDDVKRGMLVVDFGWGNPWDGTEGVNALATSKVWDPISGGTPNRLFVCDMRAIEPVS